MKTDEYLDSWLADLAGGAVEALLVVGLGPAKHLLRVEHSETAGCKSVHFTYSILVPDNTHTFKLKYENKIFPVGARKIKGVGVDAQMRSL